MRTRSVVGRVLVALATLVVAGAALVLGLARAVPAAAGASCVAVVVDFRQLGGDVATGCAQGDPSTGLQALSLAGFSETPRPRDGLTCQIDARPACTETTSTSYWSYWYRAPGSSRWVYASEGAGTHDPKPGSTEGWVWQNGGRTPPPSIRADAICPQLAATPSSTPKPTASKPTSKPSTKPKPTPSTKPTPARTRSTRRPTSATLTPSGPHSPDPSASTPTSSSASSSPASSSPATGSPASSSPATSSLAPLAATAAPPSAGSTGGSADGPTDQGGGGAALGGVAGVALGGLVVLGIGAATVIRARRGRSS